jgi:hypothetical protein
VLTLSRTAFTESIASLWFLLRCSFIFGFLQFGYNAYQCGNLSTDLSWSILISLFVLFFAVLGVEFRALCLLGRCSSSRVTSTAFLTLGIFEIGSLLIPWTMILSFVLPHIVQSKTVYHSRESTVNQKHSLHGLKTKGTKDHNLL